MLHAITELPAQDHADGLWSAAAPGNTGNVALVVFEGFSVLEIAVVAEIFRRADGMGPATRMLLRNVVFGGGGYVANSLAMRLWTESILEPCAGQLDAVFFLTGHGTPAVVAEAPAMAALGRFLVHAAVIKWDRRGVLRAAATKSANSARSRPPWPAALSLLRPELRAQIERAVR